MKLNERLFKFPEAKLLEYAQVVATMYPKDAASFMAFDSSFTAEYGDAIMDSIMAVKALKSDQVAIDEMVELTQLVLDAMADCNQSYKTIAYFVRKAFKNNKAVQNQFGFNDIEKVRRSQPKMVLFMEQHAGTSTKYKAELIAQGCQEVTIDKLLSKAQALLAANVKQEEYKKERGVLTQDRTELLNEVYKLTKPVSDVAQIVYSEDPARLAKYDMPKPKSSQNSSNDLIES